MQKAIQPGQKVLTRNEPDLMNRSSQFPSYEPATLVLSLTRTAICGRYAIRHGFPLNSDGKISSGPNSLNRCRWTVRLLLAMAASESICHGCHRARLNRPHQPRQGLDHRRLDPMRAGDFDNLAVDGINLGWAAGAYILQHRRQV